jgi:predicted ATPase
MPKLIVQNFSVIKDAELEFGKLTALIGPQSSGKSVLCKLRYFLLEAISTAAWGIARQETLKALRTSLKKKFQEEFPENTWGDEKFQISYSHGRFEIGLKRVAAAESEEGDLQLSLSASFEETYQSALQSVKSIKQQGRGKEDASELPDEMAAWEYASTSLRQLLGDGERESQLFIPAGRAFFTNFSRSFAAAQSRRTDPLTFRFGQLIARALDQRPRPVFSANRKNYESFDSNSFELLRGRIERGEGSVTFKADDGRVLTLSQLSSGTQELLPLVMALRPLAHSTFARTVYVEEPEAHLFPATQYDLVKLFAKLSNIAPTATRWVFTTHSPYILSAFNNLIVAGQLGKQKPHLKEDIAKIVPEQFWVEDGSFKAYSIHDGKLESILSESGLIDGEYLDSISNVIGNEFDALLKLEYDHSEAS